MRKVVLLMHASLDGFVGGPQGEMGWIVHDKEIFQHVSEHISKVDTSLYGRVTYQMMESYWPTVLDNPDATPLERHHAEWIEKVKKVVFSTSLKQVNWHNTQLIKAHLATEVAKLKQQPGKNMMIFGSPRLTHSFMELGLIDEYLININPIILGQGIPLFKGVKERVNLKLMDKKIFDSGVISLYYRKV